jgi:D-alanine-D-alanine ligase
MITNKTIGVLMGGTSAERDVSLRSGLAISGALRSHGYVVKDIDVGPDVARKLLDEDVEVAFLALHGGTGEDGSVQGMLEVMEIPYTGSGVLASAMAMDKLVSKKVFQASGLRVPLYEEIGLGQTPRMDFPLVIKPSREGSSVGVSIVRKNEELDEAVREALSFGVSVIAEEYIKGKEVQVGVLGSRVLGGVEVRPKREFYDYTAKYTPGLTEYILPPELEGELYERVMDTGLRAHSALGCEGATRIDLIVDRNDAVYALEVNTIPGMTETSLLPKIAGQAGMDFISLLDEMIKEALNKVSGKQGIKS